MLTLDRISSVKEEKIEEKKLIKRDKSLNKQV